MKALVMSASKNPPEGAVVLFDGKDLSNFTDREGNPPKWKVRGGAMHVVPRTGDIVSKKRFNDFFMHLEFRCPDLPEAKGQARGNSGVFLQSWYEIQVLDSSGAKVAGTGDCGAFYSQSAPLVNACKPAKAWQTYDVFFRAPRMNDKGEVVEQPRATILQNGIVIHNNTMIKGHTGGRPVSEEGKPGPLVLQDHGDLVSFRNIWIIPLPPAGSSEYQPG
ncbi:MAG TPA: DUF1080 domain-containing protein [Candidatus Brocadiia bacterium]|nr:DUF1080 domain-containing protein [Candidatus Brocadiia bacterium]